MESHRQTLLNTTSPSSFYETYLNLTRSPSRGLAQCPNVVTIDSRFSGVSASDRPQRNRALLPFCADHPEPFYAVAQVCPPVREQTQGRIGMRLPKPRSTDCGQCYANAPPSHRNSRRGLNLIPHFVVPSLVSAHCGREALSNSELRKQNVPMAREARSSPLRH
ncbi:hypothetical protein BV20DRAFT_846359 [Pilatotrama ljubarskyi]|nr:hypothetical protein BV20DRAFT_846359 [Pilatotrama ljubarskyi]